MAPAFSCVKFSSAEFVCMFCMCTLVREKGNFCHCFLYFKISMVEILNQLTKWLYGGLYLKEPICNLVMHLLLFLTQFVSMVAGDVGFLTK
jgi:hypothetical protein